MKIRVICTVFIVVAVFSGICGAYPKPREVQKIGDWTLEVVFDQPKQITVNIPGQDQPQRYWYIILTLTNNSETGEAVPFFPACELVTDTFKTVEAGKGFRKSVFNLIKLRHQGRYPFLESIEEVDSKMLLGVDNQRDVAVIWPDFDKKAKNISLFIAGLSNETVTIDHPNPNKVDENGNPEKVILQKTLALEYSCGGDENLRHLMNLKFMEKSWVLR